MISRRDRRSWSAYSPQTLNRVFPNLRLRITHATVAHRKAIAIAADGVMAGRFSALGRSWPERSSADLFPSDLWSCDPVMGTQWPGSDTYTFDIEYRHDGSHGDIKYPWEIGRLQFLPVLAMHGVLSGDDRAIRAIDAAVSSWHDANPPFTGIGWSSGIEVALRAISLIVTRDIVGDRLNVETGQNIARILAASIYWLKRFPSRYSSANNHLIAELAGEYLIGLSLGHPVDEVEKNLADELLKQIFPDGCGGEQSPSYAAFSAELVLLCQAAASERGRDFDRRVGGRLEAFARFVEWLPKAATFGDDDEGRVLTLGDEDDYPGSVAAAIRGFFGGEGFVAPGSPIRSIVFGDPVRGAEKPLGLGVFKDGGVSIWRSAAADEMELVFDHGDLGYLSIAAHGHADALSIALSVGGQPVLVDPGTWLYGSGGIWRDWFRSTMAHNTLHIEGESQSVMSGAFNWSHKANAVLVGQEERLPAGSWALTAQHTGYQRRFGVTHQRRVLYDQGRLVVTDRLLGAARSANLVFQLAAGLVTEIDGSVVRISRDNAPLLELRFPGGDISVASGGSLPGDGGWVSPRFGIKVPAPRIMWRGPVGPNGVDTVIVPCPRF
ncbi:heparinase II/III family protein [Endobacterium cereale]|nr:heparinase II/III-family protein [Endobacterium cereale]MEB2844613.1 heparinase II/III-family protein [Endobacterium cereale]